MKTVSKTVCVVAMYAAAVGVSLPLAAQAPQSARGAPPAAQKKPPPPPPSEAARVLNLSRPVVINAPGYYRLDRNWQVDNGYGNYLTIRADSVVLDFRGYTFDNRTEGTAVAILGNFVTLRNGTIDSTDDQATPLRILGSSAAIENMTVFGQEASYFGDIASSELVMRDSRIFGGVNFVPSGSILERNEFGCGARGCTLAIVDRTRVTGNVWRAGSVLIVEGEGNFVEGNTFGQQTFNPGEDTIIRVDGRHNLIRGNTIQVDGLASPAIQVNNSANVLEANIVLPIPTGDRATVGIRFTADGNFFGNNRLGALVPVDVGATTQTNWGGNVGF